MNGKEKAQKALEEGVRLGEARDWQGALAALDRILAIKPDYPLAWFIRAVALRDLGRYQEALASFDKALYCVIDDSWAWFFRGHALEALGRHLEAVESYEKALDYSPDFPEAYEGKLEALDKLEEWLKENERRPPSPFVELYSLVAGAEERLHLFLCQKLKQDFGQAEQEWWAKGVPLEIRKKCADRREEDPRRRPFHHYTDLIDLKDILDKNWRLFEADYERVRERVESKKEFLSDLVRLNEIRKSVMHPVRGSLGEEEQEFARRMRGVIGDFASLE